jgi:hypothetical protein
MNQINPSFSQHLGLGAPLGGTRSGEAMMGGMAALLATLIQLAGSLPAGTGQPGSGPGFPQAAPGFGGGGTPAVGGPQSLNNFLGGQPGGGGASRGGASGAAGSAPDKGTKDQGEIKGFIGEAAKAYGADPKVLTEMARRESNFNTGVQNNWDSNAKKGTPSKGLFQFIEPTFKSMAPKAKQANPKAWEGVGEFDWNDWRQQSLVAAWAVANGQGSHWSTFKASGGK